MSRNKRAVEHHHGLVVLHCPSGHEVGRVLQQPELERRVLYVDEGGRKLTPGEKVKLTCRSCRQNGRALDLQLSWSRLDEAMKAQLADARSRHGKITLG